MLLSVVVVAGGPPRLRLDSAGPRSGARVRVPQQTTTRSGFYDKVQAPQRKRNNTENSFGLKIKLNKRSSHGGWERGGILVQDGRFFIKSYLEEGGISMWGILD